MKVASSILRLMAALTMVIGLVVVGLGSASAQTNRPGICHATGSEQNQFTYIPPDSSAYEQHLANHFGPGGGDRLATPEEDAAGECVDDPVTPTPTPTETT